MANQPIPTLPIAVTLDGTEQLEIVQPAGSSGTSKRATSAQIAGLAATVNTSNPAAFVVTTSTLAPTNYRVLTGESGVVTITDNGVGSSIVIGLVSVGGGTVTSVSAGTGLSGGSITTAGTISLTSPVAVSLGGTGTSTLTANGVLLGNGTGSLAVAVIATSGYVLTSTGTGSAPTFQAAAGGGVTSVAAGTGLSGGTITTSGTISLTSPVTVSLGGTGTGTLTANGVLLGNGTGSLAVAVVATSGYVLTSTGTGSAPTFQAGGGLSSISGLSVLANTSTASQVPSALTGDANQMLAVNTAGTGLLFSPSPTLGTSLTSPLIIGGTGAGSTLTLESTSGTGTSDSIVFKTGSQSIRGTFNSTGYLGIGTETNPQAPFVSSANTKTGLVPAAGAAAYFISADTTACFIELDNYGAAAGPTFLCRAAGGTGASPTAVQNGNNLGNFSFRGYNGSAFPSPSPALFSAYAAENWNTTSYGTYFTLATTATGTTTRVETVRFQASGGVAIGTTADAGLGSLQISSTILLGKPLAVSYGGVGTTTLTANGILLGNGTSAVSLVAAGTSSWVLASTGTATAPAYSQVSLTAGVSGILPIANGGTNASVAATAIINLGGLALATTGQAFSGGVVLTTLNLGTSTAQTTTLVAGNPPTQRLISAGTGTIVAPSSDCEIDLLVTNATGAAALTISGYGTPGSTGDAYTTTVGSKFIFMSRTINALSTYAWKSLQ